MVLISGRVQFDRDDELPENVRRSLGKPVSERALDEVLDEVLDGNVRDVVFRCRIGLHGVEVAGVEATEGVDGQRLWGSRA